MYYYQQKMIKNWRSILTQAVYWTPDTTSELDIFLHDGDSLCMNRTQIPTRSVNINN